MVAAQRPLGTIDAHPQAWVSSRTMNKTPSGDERIDALVAEMYRNGKQIRAIEAATGLSRKTIYARLELQGVIPNRRRGGANLKQSKVALPRDIPNDEPSVMLEWALRRLLEQERTIGKLEERLAEARSRIAARSELS